MPELPDLQIFSQNLTKKLKTKKIKNVIITKDKKLNVSKETFIKSVIDNEIIDISREGKELHVHLSGNLSFGLHLMLKGQLFYFEPYRPSKSQIIEILLDDNSCLTMTDFMGQAMAILNPVVPLTPDALDDTLTLSYLTNVFTNNKATIKSLLVDQKVIRGIGNAYADEILYDSLISPFSIAGKIPTEKVRQLQSSIKSVLLNAIEEIRFKNPDAISGEVRDFLKVHISSKEITDKGEIIRFAELNSKKTYYTENQVLYN
jgi:formamidopyrimidine-DNA glycosylase